MEPRFTPNKPAPQGGPRPLPVGRFGKRKQSDEHENHRINRQINNVTEVRVVGENFEQGVYPISKAIAIAEELGVDLVEISPNAVPPVCRLVDYGKFLYEQKKKQKELKAKASKVVVKEIRFGPQTDEHDFNFKLKHAMKFLEEGSKVKAYVFFKGRSIVYKEQGEVLLLKFANELENVGKVEQLPLMEGKKMQIMIAPKKK
ncbi:MAG: translation initiation factor IF-3 [Bacteroidia bacterium]|nr:translation initiation factor IF-3 [Bacteroidia bacterium]